MVYPDKTKTFIVLIKIKRSVHVILNEKCLRLFIILDVVNSNICSNLIIH
jgi:hypothetical protein